MANRITNIFRMGRFYKKIVMIQKKDESPMQFLIKFTFLNFLATIPEEAKPTISIIPNKETFNQRISET